MAKCPHCFRTINPNTWLKDPIFLPNGAKYQWQDDTTLIEIPDIKDRIFKGFCQICEPEIQEIQDFLKQTEIDNSITPLTTWSPLNMSGKFQILGKHIKEMRDSVEKLLTNFGLTKTDYFNYDEEGNEITQPNGQKLEWTDPITNAVDLKKFQVKAIHIEDLRHYIQTYWQETWAGTSPSWIKNSSHTILYPGYPGMAYYDNASVDPIHADHDWSNGIYLFHLDNYFQTSISGVASLNLSPSGINYSNSFTLIPDQGLGFFQFHGIFGSGYHTFEGTHIGKQITSNTKFSFDGSFTGDVNLTSPLGIFNYAQIILSISSYPTDFYICFFKLGTNSLNPPILSSNILVFLPSFSGTNIKLYDLIQAAGKDMSKTYTIEYVNFAFINMRYSWSLTYDHRTLISTMNGTLGNIRIQ